MRHVFVLVPSVGEVESIEDTEDRLEPTAELRGKKKFAFKDQPAFNNILRKYMGI